MSATVVLTPMRGSGWRSVRRAAVLMLRQAAPWVLVVLVVLSLLGLGFTSWSTWSHASNDDRFIVEGDSGIAVGVSVYVGLAALFSWMRTVRTTVPVLVAGGVTRRAVTGGLLIATVALAVATTAMLAVLAVAGAALQRALAASAASVVTSSGSDAYTSALTLTTDAPANAFSVGETLVAFVVVALGGALFSAAWYRWRTRGVIGVLVALGAVWSIYAAVTSWAAVATSNALNSAAGAPLVQLGLCLVLAAAVSLVLRRVPLRPPAQ